MIMVKKMLLKTRSLSLLLPGMLLGYQPTAQAIGPEPAGWYAGDMHVHRSCGDSPVTVSSIYNTMTNQDVAVVSLLADMGNGEVQNPGTDLPLVNGQDDPISTADRIVHWDAEWHWDATYSQYPHQALGGHLVALGLTNAYQIWEEYTYPIFEWVHRQGGIAGFAHFQKMDDNFPPDGLGCCFPVEYPVEVALGACDFISEDVDGSDYFLIAYYRLLNCGFRPGFAAGSDYPCDSVIGPLLTYAQMAGGSLTYSNWIGGIAKGRTAVSRNGRNEFLNLKVNDSATPGDEIQLPGGESVQVDIQWTANQSLTGTVELVCNGKVVASKAATAAPGAPNSLNATVDFTKSGWLCARRLNSDGNHVFHTAAVFVTVDHKPVRASATDAQFYVDWTDNLLQKTSTGGVWSSYFATNLALAQGRYSSAKSVYQQVFTEANVPPSVSITTTSLPARVINMAYSASLTASGGTLPYTWSITNGSLPSGLTLTGGLIGGTPTATGTFDFVAQVSDASSLILSATKSFSITILQPVSIATTSLSNGVTNVVYSATLLASGGKSPYTWSVASGSLAPGLTLTSGGVIDGTPSTTGTFDFVAQVVDASGLILSATKSFSITILQPVSIATTSLSNGVTNVVYSATLLASGGKSPYTWSVASGSLAPGLTLTSGGVIDGTPSTTGTFDFVAQVVDASGLILSATKSFSITILQPVSIATTSLSNGVTNVVYSATLLASGGKSPYTWSVASGSLPPGLTLTSGGVIGGTPSTTGTFDFVAQVVDASGLILSATKSFSITILQPVSIATISLPNGGMNVVYSATLLASGGKSPYTWSVASGSLPPGLTLTSGGVIGGTPSTTGTFNFVAQVVDASGLILSATKSLSITILQPFVITTASLSNGIMNVAYTGTLTATGGTLPYTWSIAGGIFPPGLTLASSGVITGKPTASGFFSFTGRVTDVGNPIHTATKQLNITIVTTIWSNTTVPGVVDGGPDSSVELGVKFKSDVNGTITGIRFYKAGVNTGTHVGNLWASNGLQLATTVTFSNETASGWQQALFDTPVVIASNTVYVASYHANDGHYSADNNYFQGKGANNPPLHALTNSAASPNGVYAYGASSVFPNQTWSAANYWVDVVFMAGSPPPAPTLTTITVTPTNSIILTGASQQFTATGTYSDGSTQNITSQAAWASSNTVVATITTGGLATGGSVGSATISATLTGVTGSALLTVQTSPLTIGTTSLSNGIVNVAYTGTLRATGGTLPYIWSLAGGALAPGLALNGSGVITGTPTAMGTFNFTAEVRDTSSPVQTTNKLLSMTITSAPVVVSTIWSSTTVPTEVDSGPDSAVELGVKFRSDVNGSITGIRFYKANANTGTHIGNLWVSNGLRLATVTFSNETASGWQQALFDTPVAITSNAVYVASYHANNGHYSGDNSYFLTRGVDNPPLHALVNDASDGNGIYAYGASSVFPTQTWNAANYWVDVVFMAGSPPPAPTLTTITVTPTNSIILTGTSQQFTATGTYSDGSAQNITSQATWASSNTVVATIATGGLATGISAGDATISAALAGVTGNTTLTVKPPLTLTSITVMPTNSIILTGTLQQFTATGTYSDGSTQNITSQATWASSNTVVATINTGGLATGVSAGDATISAALAGVINSTKLTVLSTPLVITTTSLPTGFVNVAYSATLTASGGTLPYAWSLVSGSSLPGGLVLNANGAITGTPTTKGPFNFTVQVMDASSPVQITNKVLNVTIVDPLVVNTTTLPAGISNVAYSATLMASGGTAPYNWSFAGGSFPSGLMLSNNGVISGTPAAVGIFSFTGRVSDASSPMQITNKALTIIIMQPIAITTTILPTGISNVAYSATLTATGGTSPYTWSLAGGVLTPGLTLNGSGVITGKPTAVGTFNFTAQVRDTSSLVQTTNKLLSMTIVTVPAVTIWPTSAVPVRADAGADSTVELGVKFRSDVNGSITGIRFYKAGANTGTHIGNLWTSNGLQLATVTFANETASGWQQMLFSTPVAITSNTVYVASYHANSGHYSDDDNYFLSSGVDNPPLHALANGASDGNGVYAYGASNVFPNQTWNAGNYWVDVVFQAGPPPPPPALISIMVTPTNSIILTGASQQFTATGTYSDGSTQNITSQAVWASSNTVVATITTGGLATGGSVGSATISAALTGVTGSALLTVQTSPLTIGTTSLSNGIVNVAYTGTLRATGGTLPYIWSLAGGALTPGLTLNGSGVITGKPTASGTFNFTAQVRDTSSPVQTTNKLLSITIVSAPVVVSTIWPNTTVPGQVDGGPDSAVELGVKFRSDVNGSITGIRFYKADANTGTHIGNLWVSNGLRLATVTFSNETASGWQQALFDTPVAITSNAVYVASYHANNGHYSDDNYFFARGVDNPPLHALATVTDVSSNGVYAYGSSSLFPTQTFHDANYWVDVMFQAASPTLMSIVVTPATPRILNGASQQFTATGIYSDGSTENLTGHVTWSSSNTVVATITTGGLATGGSAGATTIYATLASVTGSTVLTVQSPIAITTTLLPNGAVSVAYAGQLTAANGTLPYTWSVVGGSLPSGLTLNPSSGAITGTPTTVGTSFFIIEVRDADYPMQITNKLLSIAIQQSIVITTTWLPNGVSNRAYTATLTAGGGIAPYTWSVVGGNLPSGLTLNPSSGAITGTPTTVGTSNFIVQVMDAANPAHIASNLLSITILQPLAITTTTLPKGVGNLAYTATLTANGGMLPYIWSTVDGGSLPPGLTLNPSSGVITGIPTATGTFSFIAHVSDADDPTQTAIKLLSISIQPSLAITTTILPNGVTTVPYTATLTADGGSLPYTWSVAGSLPSGLTLNSTSGVISGMPTATGTFSFIAQVRDAGNPEQTASNVLSITIMQSFTVTTTFLPNGTSNVVYTATLTATNGILPYTWSVGSGSLPSGLTLNPNGVISGVPTSVGTSNFLAQVRDSGTPPQIAFNLLSITIMTVSSPILVLTNAANPFSQYYAEILLTEGLNEFDLKDRSSISSATLAQYNVVILGEAALAPSQVTTLSDWVNAGGNLIAMRPDKQLAGFLGLNDAGSTITNGYLLVNTSTGPGAGIVGETIQFHGTADRYTLGSAFSLATLYSNAQIATINPAVTLRSIGTNGGQAAAFTYDLARSIVYTRQGNPAWAGQDRDGNPPIRSDDLFYGAATNDMQPDWIDLNKVAIPQADEQQRLLANLIIAMNSDKNLLPRFWYFPHGYEAVVVMTGDDHAGGGTAGRFDRYKALSPIDGSVDDWTAIRGTSYIYPNLGLTDAQAAAYNADGFEIAMHLFTGCENYTPDLLDQMLTEQFSQFANTYPSLPSQATHRIHCIVWGGYTVTPEVELLHGIRLDVNYYYWPSNWVVDRPGFFTGSGMPMRFATTTGNVIDVYQAVTEMTDESGQSYPYTIDFMLDRALGPEGYYGAFVANAHTDVPNTPESDAMVTSATNREVPVISARQLLTWLDARNASSLKSISWNNGRQTFSVNADAKAKGLQAMVPVPDGCSASSVKYKGSPIGYYLRGVKGFQYAIFPVTNGDYEVGFEPDTNSPSVTEIVPTNGQSGVGLNTKVNVTFNEAMNVSSINTNTITLRDSLLNPVSATVSYNASSFTAVLTPSAPLAPLTTYIVTVKGNAGGLTDAAGNSMASDLIWTFTTIEVSTFSIWPDMAVPSLIDSGPDDPVELGVKFRSDVAGTITGIRFYKALNNTSPHVGNLWTSLGTHLASATFTNETASGWQQVFFDPPVTIASNMVYVASYHTTNGHYSVDFNYFQGKGADNPPLHALANGVSDGNGVFVYGAGGVFPNNQSWNAPNYWVDVIFETR